MIRSILRLTNKFVSDNKSSAIDLNMLIGRFAILACGHGLGILFGFLAMVVMVRSLGPTGYGYIALALSVLNYGLVFSNFGGDLVAVKATAQDRGRLAENLFNVAATRLLFSAPIYIIILGVCVAGVWPPAAVGPILIVCLSSFVTAFYPLWVPQAIEKVGVVAMTSAAAQAIFLLCVVLVAQLKGGAWGFALAKLVADALIAVTLFSFVAKTEPLSTFRIRFAKLKAFWREAFPLGFSQILRSLAIGSDLIILSFLVSAAALGVYAVSFRIFLLALSITGMFFVVVLPIFSRLANEPRDVLQRAVSGVMVRMAPIAFFAALVCALLAEFVIVHIFGKEFADAVLPLQILMAAAAANFINRGYRQVLLALGCRREDLTTTAVSAFVNLVLKFLLIPVFGLLGAALSTALGEITLLVMQRAMAIKALRGKSDH